ncbi:MAG: hypothetical protein ACLR4A_01615 [Christensenellales bacterium]
MARAPPPCVCARRSRAISGTRPPKQGTAIRQTSSGEKRGVPFSGRDRSMMSGCSAIGAESSPAARFTPPVGLKMS